MLSVITLSTFLLLTSCSIVSCVNHAKQDDATSGVPLLFILGVQKGGSSSLYTFLMLHPLLCGGKHKEAHFFDHDDFYSKGRGAYASWYDSKENEKCVKHKKTAVYVDGTPQMHYADKSRHNVS